MRARWSMRAKSDIPHSPPFTSATVNSNCRLWLCRALRWPPPHFGFGHAAGPASGPARALAAAAAAAAAAAVAAATALTDLTALTECRSCHPRHPCLWPWIRRWADRRRSQPRTHRTVRRRSPSARAAAGRSGLKARRRPPVRRPPARAPRDGDAGCPSRNLSRVVVGVVASESSRIDSGR